MGYSQNNINDSVMKAVLCENKAFSCIRNKTLRMPIDQKNKNIPRKRVAYSRNLGPLS